MSLSRVELTPACCGRAVCGMLKGAPWNVGAEDQEKLVNACRSLKGWKARESATKLPPAERSSECEVPWPDVVVDAGTDSDAESTSEDASV